MTFGVATPQRFKADLVGYDSAERPVLVVEAKAHPIQYPRETLDFLVARAGPVDFWLLADPSRLQLYAAGRPAADDGPLVELSTPAILAEYDPTWADRDPSEFYLVALVDAWVRDLALRWRSPEPPGTAALRGTGLLERLAGGSTERDAIVDGDRLR